MNGTPKSEIPLTSQEQALAYIDVQLRRAWEVDGFTLGGASILEEARVGSHTAWQYTFEGMPVSRDSRRHWLLDTGETLDTTIAEGQRTLEQAYQKLRSLR